MTGGKEASILDGFIPDSARLGITMHHIDQSTYSVYSKGWIHGSPRGNLV